jgi:hypothetical protein
MKRLLFSLWLALGWIIQTNILVASHIWVWGGDGSITNVPVDLTNAVAISAGDAHALALTSDGRVVAWGDNSANQTNVPSDLSNVVAIAAGSSHSLALQADGTVRGWGDNTFGESTPPAGLTNVVAVSAGNYFSLALKADGTVTAWGTHSPFGETDVPADLTNAIAVSAGIEHGLALRSDGTVTGWGQGPYVMSLSNIVAVSDGNGLSLALSANGSVFAWGMEKRCGSTLSYPSVPADLTNAIAIAAGSLTSIALRADGSVVVWGCGAVNPPVGLSGASAVCTSGMSGLPNPCYFALSDVAQAIVPVSILFAGPLSQTVGEGSQTFFSVTAAGPPPLTYQWYFGSNAVMGATNRWLSLTNVQFSQAGSYTVKVSNTETSATSQPLILNVAPSLKIFLVPAISLEGAVGSNYRVDYINAAGPTNAWNTLATITLTNTQQFYSDYTAIGQPARFYRLVQVP